ncbi:uncharacterized protein LOC105917768 isoform X2 [Fundulus heteroclitus]|uniref:uncharacterized protein LOC105917768 isoform X2 n=1 Tax=Fundulus heteroclitus TaxID=8078 RepID=UPI00165B2350|nr:uncharacterized protein LOC105917768 isoform X2 [Fundulus heteroclitus]
MLVLIWAALLLTVTGSGTNNTRTDTENGSPNNRTVTNPKPDAGQCPLTKVKSFTWCKCQPCGVCNQQMNNSGNNDNDLKKNCCIINNFTTSDEKIYQVKAEAEEDCRKCIYEANITVKVCPSNGSTSDVQCVSEGFSLPIITWPLLNSYEYTASTTVSSHSVIGNMTMRLEYSSEITVKCTSKNDSSEIKENMCSSEEPNKQQNQGDTNFFDRLKKIFEDQLLFFLVFGVGILIGSLVAGFIACLAIQCCRKKKSHSTEELELVTTEPVPKFCDDGTLDLQDDGIQNHVAAEVGEEPAVDLVDSDLSPKDTVYSDIDFSAMKEKNPTAAKEQGDATETEYAEIKRGEMDEAQENEEMDCEMLAGNDETDVIIEHQGERKQGLLAEEVIGEDVPLCSNTNEEGN